MAEELISVILPVYNIEKYLEKCMSSLFCQTYSNLEFVIVDDGSAKVCADLCDAMAERDSRVSVYHKKNGGSLYIHHSRPSLQYPAVGFR